MSRHLKVPAVALRGKTILPGMIDHFDITRKKSVAAIEKAMALDEKVFLITQKNSDELNPDENGFYECGTYCVIRQLAKVPQNMVRVMVEGIKKCRMISAETEGDFITAEISECDSPKLSQNDAENEAKVRVIKDCLSDYASTNRPFAEKYLADFLKIESLPEILNRAASSLQWDYRIMQQVLDSTEADAMYHIIVRELMRETQIEKIKRDFQMQLRDSIDKNQKEYILREQMKIIQQELGDSTPQSEAEEYLKRCDELTAPDEVKEKIRKEISYMKGMPGGGQELNVIRTYLDTLLSMPWNRVSEDNRDIRHAAEILNEDHYGLDKVKERVVEYLAVRMLNQSSKGPVLCLVGPPGTGKTSIAKSVARALNRKYVRISLGGIRDEAEIRGHRKTYVGAMPGRIAESLRYAGVANPLMLLDEIDKVSGDYRGDTASALLEVLDGEQNIHFRDHYIELPTDLSQVLFIATANTTETIPDALLDRMEVIEVSSYTENEKFHIARDFLLKKQMEENGIPEGRLQISDAALKKIIHNYTREAGVRNAERRIGDICRKCAREILEGRKTKINITEHQLEKYLGREKINFEDAGKTDEIGIVRGLAWTKFGGDTLEIEVNIMPGKGKLVLTGQMGDVMKESAQAALSCIRGMSSEFRVSPDYYEKHDIHIHIPEGAVPKDGPSAGITMATAMLSAVTGRKVRSDVCMTGEITLRGRILPIGGLKEKILAARMAHLKTVIVPDKNRPDVAELSEEITGGMQIVYAEMFRDVLKTAFVREKGKKSV
jgi:ATP-dependent Lon protease